MTEIKKSRTTVANIWFGLLMIYLVTSYFAQDVLLPAAVNSIVLYVFLAFSAFAVICQGKIKLYNILPWGLLFLAFSFVAMLYSPEFSILSGTYYSMIVNFILVFILSQMPWDSKRFDMIMKTFAWVSAALIIVLAMTGNLVDDSADGRLGTELFGNANTLAMMLMVGAIYAVWVVISSEKISTKITYFVLLAVIYIGMFLSGGRKFVVLPIIFLFVLLLNKADKKGRSHLIRNTVITAVAVVALYLLIMKVPMFYDIIGVRFEEFFAVFGIGEQEVDSSTRLRMQMIDAAWNGWLDSPIWGHGFDSFKYYNARSVTGHMYYSHNNFVELLYNQGIIGFVTYYFMYGYVLVKALKRKGRSLSKGFAIAVIVSLLAFEYFGVTYSSISIQIMLFFAYLKIMEATNEQKRDKQEN